MPVQYRNPRLAVKAITIRTIRYIYVYVQRNATKNRIAGNRLALR